jgi:hypothetical protein
MRSTPHVPGGGTICDLAPCMLARGAGEELDRHSVIKHDSVVFKHSPIEVERKDWRSGWDARLRELYLGGVSADRMTGETAVGSTRSIAVGKMVPTS